MEASFERGEGGKGGRRSAVSKFGMTFSANGSNPPIGLGQYTHKPFFSHGHAHQNRYSSFSRVDRVIWSSSRKRSILGNSPLDKTPGTIIYRRSSFI